MKTREKVEELQVIALCKYIEWLDDKNETGERTVGKNEASMKVYILSIRDTIRNDVSKIKTYIMKEVHNKFDQIINFIKKSRLV